MPHEEMQLCSLELEEVQADRSVLLRASQGLRESQMVCVRGINVNNITHYIIT